jgi:2-amino-4-hydroxy-6-hydroxymethyldihydropteridine diphosphokinase
MPRAWIGLGSNLGDRLGHIRRALGLIEGLPETALAAVSSVYDTAPWGRTDQPRFLNAVAEVTTGLEPVRLLEELLAIEDRCGRVRRDRWGPRTIDLDLLVYDGVEISSGVLEVPHPRLAERAFVLVPLAEIAPAVVVPGLGKTARDLARALGRTADEVRRVGDPPGALRNS